MAVESGRGLSTSGTEAHFSGATRGTAVRCVASGGRSTSEIGKRSGYDRGPSQDKFATKMSVSKVEKYKSTTVGPGPFHSTKISPLKISFRGSMSVHCKCGFCHIPTDREMNDRAGRLIEEMDECVRILVEGNDTCPEA